MNTDPPTTIRQPRAAWLGGLFTAVLLGLLCAFMLGGAVLAMTGGNFAVGAVLAAVAGVMGVLFRYVLRDARAKRNWRITVGTDTLELELPRGRSLVHRLDPVRAKIRFDEIEAVETRLEAYRSFAMANMQRSYALRLKAGDTIILGEDRALGTALASDFFAGAVDRIVGQGKLPTRDLGMAEGKGGILSVLFTRPPPWDAPALGAEQQSALWRRAVLTGQLAMFLVALVLFALLVQSFFQAR
jgi:hypothetical protein